MGPRGIAEPIGYRLRVDARRAVVACALIFGSACASRNGADRRLEIVRLTPPTTGPLLVLLPGRRDHARDFDRFRFGRIAQEAGAPFEIVAADVGLPRYLRRTVVTDLEREVVGPARTSRPVWLGGISLGALGSILYAREHPDHVHGLILIAPYLGEPKLVREIVDAGGLAAWSPPEDIPDDDPGRKAWSFLRREIARGERPILLAYGTDDRLAPAHALLARALPPERVVTAPGGHRWAVWRKLWRRLVVAQHPP